MSSLLKVEACSTSAVEGRRVPYRHVRDTSVWRIGISTKPLCHHDSSDFQGIGRGHSQLPYSSQKKKGCRETDMVLPKDTSTLNTGPSL